MDYVRQTRSWISQVSDDSTSDRISNLSCDILDKIVFCLPIQYAARTSILSKRWRFRWLYTPQLVFDEYIFFGRKYNKSIKSRREIISLISQILKLHRGTLHKFILSTPPREATKTPFLNSILLSLAGKDIRELTFGPSAYPYKFPSTVFQLGHLTHLNLSGCKLTVPPEFIGFSRLIDLELRRVVISDNDLTTLISNCPLLLHLKLQQTSDEHNWLEIDAPNLKFLCFSYSSVSIIFRNVPLLSTVIITSHGARPVLPFDIVQMFCSLTAMEYFYADHNFIMVERLPIALNCLKSVELCGLCFSSTQQVQCALFLIRSSPNLQKLKIVSRFTSVRRGGMADLYENVSKSEDSLHQLQEVTMERFLGSEPELEFLKFILARSLILKKAIIFPASRFPVEDEQECFIAVTRLRRASPKAEFIYVDPNKFRSVNAYQRDLAVKEIK